MPTSPEEAQDLIAMKIAVQEEKLRTFDLMHEYNRMSAEELKHSGHKSQEAALKYSMDRATKEIEKIHKAFLKKWPDK
jgi:hypothetical protein